MPYTVRSDAIPALPSGTNWQVCVFAKDSEGQLRLWRDSQCRSLNNVGSGSCSNFQISAMILLILQLLTWSLRWSNIQLRPFQEINLWYYINYLLKQYSEVFATVLYIILLFFSPMTNSFSFTTHNASDIIYIQQSSHLINTLQK